jgi:hypothetical protein
MTCSLGAKVIWFSRTIELSSKTNNAERARKKGKKRKVEKERTEEERNKTARKGGYLTEQTAQTARKGRPGTHTEHPPRSLRPQHHEEEKRLNLRTATKALGEELVVHTSYPYYENEEDKEAAVSGVLAAERVNLGFARLTNELRYAMERGDWDRVDELRESVQGGHWPTSPEERESVQNLGGVIAEVGGSAAVVLEALVVCSGCRTWTSMQRP